MFCSLSTKFTMPGIKKAQVHCQNKVFKTNIGKEVVENVGAESVS